MVNFAKEGKSWEKFDNPFGFLIGCIFGLGLAVSGMCRRTKVIGFLTIYENWDPSLGFVMASAVGINVFTFHYIIKKKQCPIMREKLEVPTNNKLDLRLVLGAALFGIGWGLAGLCPGPAMIDFFNMTHAILWLPSLAVG